MLIVGDRETARVSARSARGGYTAVVSLRLKRGGKCRIWHGRAIHKTEEAAIIAASSKVMKYLRGSGQLNRLR